MFRRPIVAFATAFVPAAAVPQSVFACAVESNGSLQGMSYVLSPKNEPEPAICATVWSSRNMKLE